MVRQEKTEETRSDLTGSEAFNRVAASYDAEFTGTAVGRVQRAIVWDYLEEVFSGREGLDVLELNCGTGEDAVWMARKGHRVLATDIAKEMLKITEAKAAACGVESGVSTGLLDVSDPSGYPKEKRFDLVFSNFGGFNCISPEDLSRVLPLIAAVLKPEGRFVAVVMPAFCLWEWAYFTAKGKFREAVRRKKRGPVEVPLGGSTVMTWYHSPSAFRKAAGANFRIAGIKPVGLFVPPSYLNSYFSRHPGFLKTLQKIETGLAGGTFLAAASDHYLIDMEGVA